LSRRKHSSAKGRNTPARARFEQAHDHWSCHLFAQIDDSTRPSQPQGAEPEPWQIRRWKQEQEGAAQPPAADRIKLSDTVKLMLLTRWVKRNADHGPDCAGFIAKINDDGTETPEPCSCGLRELIPDFDDDFSLADEGSPGITKRSE